MTTTIGVALAVPEPWGARLQDYRTALGEKTADGIPTHVTLVPPTVVAPAELSVVEKHLVEASSAAPAFRMHLRGTGTFRPVSPVVFVTVTEGMAACENLAWSVRQGPLAAELAFPYHPHVTIAHHLEDEMLDRALDEMAGFECDFLVDRLSLYVHERDTGWVPTRDFALTGPSAG